MARAATATVINEVVVTLTPLGNDLGTTATTDWDPTVTTWPTSGLVTMNLDEITIATNRNLIDNSGAQSLTPKMRITKQDFTITIDTKIHLDGYELDLLTDAVKSEVIGVTLSGVKNSFQVACVVESFSANYSNPTKLSMVLKPYGTAVKWNTVDDLFNI